MKHRGGEDASVRSGRISNPLRNSKIVKCEGNCENLFSKIAEPNPIFCKDSESRAKTGLVPGFPRRILSKTMSKIERGKSNCENLFSKIAEPNPIFYKDRKSRMQKQIYLHFPEAEF